MYYVGDSEAAQGVFFVFVFWCASLGSTLYTRTTLLAGRPLSVDQLNKKKALATERLTEEKPKKKKESDMFASQRVTVYGNDCNRNFKRYASFPLR